MSELNGDWTLDEARDWTRDRAEDGVECPLCTLYVRVYKHKCDSAMARTAIRMYHAGAQHEPLHVPSLDGDNHKVSQLAWWGLVRDEGATREDGGRGGYWWLTELGVAFVERRHRIRERVRIFDARVLSYRDEYVDIEDCLGDKFRYDELMAR